MKSKRGMSLPIETVIIIIIAVAVLALVLLFVTGKWAALTGTDSALAGIETGIEGGAQETVNELFE